MYISTQILNSNNCLLYILWNLSGDCCNQYQKHNSSLKVSDSGSLIALKLCWTLPIAWGVFNIHTHSSWGLLGSDNA